MVVVPPLPLYVVVGLKGVEQVLQEVALVDVLALHLEVIVGRGRVAHRQPLVVEAGLEIVGEPLLGHEGDAVGREIDGLGTVVAEPLHAQAVPYPTGTDPLVVVGLGDAQLAEACSVVDLVVAEVLVVEHLVAMLPQDMLDDEFRDDVALVGADVDGVLLHALQFVEMVLQHVGRAHVAVEVDVQQLLQVCRVARLIERADEQLQVGGAGVVGKAFECIGSVFVHMVAAVLLVASHAELLQQRDDVVGVGIRNAARQPLLKVGLLGQFLLRAAPQGVERAQVVSLVDLIEVAPRSLVLRMLVDVLVPLSEETADLRRVAVEQDRVVELLTSL